MPLAVRLILKVTCLSVPRIWPWSMAGEQGPSSQSWGRRSRSWTLRSTFTPWPGCRASLVWWNACRLGHQRALDEWAVSNATLIMGVSISWGLIPFWMSLIPDRNTLHHNFVQRLSYTMKDSSNTGPVCLWLLIHEICQHALRSALYTNFLFSWSNCVQVKTFRGNNLG